MSNNDWTNKLREQLADYQEPVSDDLWAGIEQSLAQKGIITDVPSISSASKSSAKKVFLRRFSMAAAIAALAVGGICVYKLSQADTSSGWVATLPAPTGKFKPVVDGVPSNLPVAQVTKVSPAQLATLLEKLSLKEKDVTPLEVNGSSQEESIAMQGENAARQEEPAAQQKEEPVKYKKVEKNHEPLLASASGDVAYEISHHRQVSGVTVNLYGENGMVSMNSSSASPWLNSSSMAMDDPVFMAQPPKMDEYMAENALFASYKEAAYQEEIKHHQPISIGVQVGIGLAPRLRLTTGLVYTTTSSDFIGKVHGTVTNSTKQDLSYVGIPVSLSYDVWGLSRLHTYVTVGGEGAVNVKNHTETDGQKIDTKRDRMQWSSQAAVGIQYDILPQVGVYVEPGMKYYFDNGSQIENVFKEKKLNFNFQFGLRWELGK